MNPLAAIFAIIEKAVPDPQKQAEIKAQIQQVFYQYQSDFISKTSDWLTRVVRQLLVMAFSAALFFPQWGATLADNAAKMPVYFWLIILWEFYGAAAIQVLPWFKGNGKTVVAAVAGNDPIPPLPDPVDIRHGD